MNEEHAGIDLISHDVETTKYMVKAVLSLESVFFFCSFTRHDL